MLKRYFEILLVISVGAIIIYTLLYFFYLDKYCEKLSQDKIISYTDVINKIGNCKDTFVCSIGGIEKDNKNNIINWRCSKKIMDILEVDFYKKELEELKEFIK